MTETLDEYREALAQGDLQERRDALLDTTREALESHDLATLRLILNSQHPVDLAELLGLLDEEERDRCLHLLAQPLAARVLAELDAPVAQQLAADLDARDLSGIVEEMAPDDAADVLADLPEDHSERVLSMMEADDAAEVRQLMVHPEDTGGGIMTSRLLAVREDVSVEAAVDILRAWAEEDEIYSVFVVDADRRLVGAVSLWRLLLAHRDELLSDLADRDPITVRADMDQEEIAEIFADYDLVVLPVVDDEAVLVGQVTVDDIVDVIRDEATEDNLKMAATSSEEMEERAALGIVRRRLPWLLFCLGGTLLSGTVLALFTGVLTSLHQLVLFVPAIMAMGGNSGLQSSTVTVRSLATGVLHRDQVRRALWRELRVALVLGVFLGLVEFSVAYLWTGGSPVAPCAGFAMLVAVLLSAILGAFIPLAFRAIGVDPAVASGPLITTLNDVTSLSIYLGTATALLPWLSA